MKFTYGITMVDPEFYVPLAVAAEEAGFDAVSLSDSIGYPRDSDSKYPYTPDGGREFLENKPFIEPLIATATMAAATTRLKFRTGVLKLPVRHPVVFAKEVTSLAVMTHNRFVLGVGSSPWPEDYQLVGLPWAARGRRFDECIEVIRGLSEGTYFEYHGEFYDFPPVKINPVPTQPIPLVVGGQAPAQVERAARVADGWMPNAVTTEDLVPLIEKIHARRTELGRTGEFEIFASNADSRTAEGVKRLADIGVTHTGGGFGRFNPYALELDAETLQEKIDALRRYSDDVIAKAS